jgi:hypothetical protein
MNNFFASLNQHREVYPPADPIYWNLLVQDPGKYLAYGNFIRNGHMIYQMAKNGLSHLTGKGISKIAFNTVEKSVTQVKDVITVGAGVHLEGGSCAIIDDKVWVFTPRTDDSADMIDAGYYVSTDGLTGEAFGSFTQLPLPPVNARQSYYGEPFKVENNWYVTFADVNTSGDNLWHMRLFKSTDNGASWSYTTMKNDTLKISEQQVIYLGSGRMLSLGRLNNGPWGLHQSVSSDYGETWGAWSECSMTTALPNSGASNCAMCRNYKGLIDVVFMVRGESMTYISKDNDPNSVFLSPSNWNAASELRFLSGTFEPLGYLNIINIDDGRSGRIARNNYLITMAKDNGDSTTSFIYLNKLFN